jgi:hypothetical protein
MCLLRRWFWAELLGCTLLLGCALGGQTGQGDGIVPSACIESGTRVLGLEEPTELGFTGAEALALFAPAGRAEGAWYAEYVTDAAGQATPSPSVTPRSVQVAFQLQPRDGGVRWIGHVANPEVNAQAYCSGRLEIDVDGKLSLSAAADSLDLPFSATITAHSKYVAELQALELEPAGEAQLQGLLPGETLRGYQVYAYGSEAARTGTLWAVAEHTEYPQGWLEGDRPQPQGDAPRAGPWVAERAWVVAAWPAQNACEPTQLQVPLESSMFEITPLDALSRFDVELPLTWDDGSMTSLVLGLEPLTTDACIATACSSFCEFGNYFEAPEDRSGVGFPVRVSLTTADGRWNGRLDTILRAEAFHTGGWGRIALNHQAAFATTAALEQRLGLSAPGWQTGGEGTLTLDLWLDVAAGEAAPSGQLELTVADVSAPCESQCTGVPAGHQVLGGSIGEAASGP